MDHFPTLYTERLILRKMTVDDIPSLLKHVNNRAITDQIINFPYPYQEPQAVFRMSYVHRGFKKGERFVFAITLKEKKELIGEISLHLDKAQPIAEVGYWVGEPFWNQGIVTEALKRLLSFGFEVVGLDLIFATYSKENIASGKVLLKNGMQIVSPGQYHPTIHTPTQKVVSYQLTKEEYHKTNSAS
ncbi:MAG: GNAT family N-acetyltransferase [Bacteroidota bacterium]